MRPGEAVIWALVVRQLEAFGRPVEAAINRLRLCTRGPLGPERPWLGSPVRCFKESSNSVCNSLPLRNGQVECTTIAALRQRQKERAFRTFSRAHRHCRPSAHLTLRPQLALTKHARPTPAGAPTPKSHARLTTLLRPRPQVPHHLCAASPLLLLCCVAFVPSHSLPPFAPPYFTSPRHPSRLPILRSAAYSRLLSLSPSPGTSNRSKPSHRAISAVRLPHDPRRTPPGAPIADSWPSLLLHLGLLIP